MTSTRRGGVVHSSEEYAVSWVAVRGVSYIFVFFLTPLKHIISLHIYSILVARMFRLLQGKQTNLVGWVKPSRITFFQENVYHIFVFLSSFSFHACFFFFFIHLIYCYLKKKTIWHQKVTWHQELNRTHRGMVRLKVMEPDILNLMDVNLQY